MTRALGSMTPLAPLALVLGGCPADDGEAGPTATTGSTGDASGSS